eukprot:UN05008
MSLSNDNELFFGRNNFTELDTNCLKSKVKIVGSLKEFNEMKKENTSEIVNENLYYCAKEFVETRKKNKVINRRYIKFNLESEIKRYKVPKGRKSSVLTKCEKVPEDNDDLMNNIQNIFKKPSTAIDETEKQNCVQSNLETSHTTVVIENIKKPVEKNNDELPFPCQKCTKRFTTKYGLMGHQRVHKKKKVNSVNSDQLPNTEQKQDLSLESSSISILSSMLLLVQNGEELLTPGKTTNNISVKSDTTTTKRCQ